MNKENFYFDAEYAHKMTDEIANGKLQEDLDKVYKYINSAMSKGEYRCVIDFGNRTISDFLINKLKASKFKIDVWHGDQRDPANDLIITW